MFAHTRMYVCMWVRLCMYVCVSAFECVCVCCWDWTQDFVCSEYWAIFYLREATISFSVSVYRDKILNFGGGGGKNGNLTWETYVGLQKSPKLHETVGWFWCKYILISRASFLGWKPLDCTKVSKTFRSYRDYFKLLKLLVVTLTRIQRVIYIYLLPVLCSCSL